MSDEVLLRLEQANVHYGPIHALHDITFDVRLSDFAVGDQVAVTAADLLAELPGCDPAAEVRTRGALRTARDVVADAAAALAATRRLL